MNTIRRVLYCALAAIFIFGCTQDHDDPVFNKVPIANAGPSQTITLPTQLTLTGSGTDQDGQVLAYLWSEVSGPNTPVIVTPGASTTSVTGIIAGNYVFQLMVTDDDGATGVDTVSVKVNAAPEQTLTLQPGSNPYDISLSLFNGADHSGISYLDLPIQAWTNGGAPVYVRSLMKFDLSTIPANATIVSANLSLSSYPPPTLNGNFVDANFGTTNGLVVQRVTNDWSPSTVTWFNQPASTTSNQILVPQTNSSQLDLSLDVTSMVAAMVANSSNYGFSIRLQNEVAYNCRIFASSYYTANTAKRPKLVVVYR